MSDTTSEATGRRYGIERVCRAWERSRSALYARRSSAQKRQEGEEPARRGPNLALRYSETVFATTHNAMAAHRDSCPVKLGRLADNPVTLGWLLSQPHHVEHVV